jgi:hypothetical protein
MGVRMGLSEKRAYLFVELITLQDIDPRILIDCTHDRACNETLNEIAVTVEEEE